jgi:hypothetical protein
MVKTIAVFEFVMIIKCSRTHPIVYNTGKENLTMAKSQRQSPRKPATKFPQLRKKLQQQPKVQPKKPMGQGRRGQR